MTFSSELGVFPLLHEFGMPKSHVRHDQVRATVDVENGASHVGGSRAGQEEHGVGYVLDLAEAEEGNFGSGGLFTESTTVAAAFLCFGESCLGSLLVVSEAGVS